MLGNLSIYQHKKSNIHDQSVITHTKSDYKIQPLGSILVSQTKTKHDCTFIDPAKRKHQNI